MNKREISFKKLPIAEYYGEPIYDVWHVIVNGKPVVLDSLLDLDESSRKETVDIISRMATREKYYGGVEWRLKKRKYGEIKPWGHRFFFFVKFGENIVIFDYREKKRKGPLKSEVYKLVDKNREKYEEEFRRFINKNQ